MPEKRVIYVGSRKSQLALAQTEYVIEQLKNLHLNYEFQIVKIDTFGDNVLDKALPKIGEKAAFTKELEIALEKGEIDIVVHSLKDLPTTLPVNMVIGSVLRRINYEDVIIINQERYPNTLISQLPKDRGNINTRIRKLDEGHYDAIVLAAAGLQRLHWDNRITQPLDWVDYYYAVGQGALAVECMGNRGDMLDLLEPLTHWPTLLAVVAERSFLKAIQGGCSAPVGIRCGFEGNQLVLRGMVSDVEANRIMCQECVIDLSLPADPSHACQLTRPETEDPLPNKISTEQSHTTSTAQLPTGPRTQKPESENIPVQCSKSILHTDHFTITDIYVPAKALSMDFLEPESWGDAPPQHKLPTGLSVQMEVDKRVISSGLQNPILRAQLCGQELARLMIKRGADLILKLARQQCEEQACDTDI